MQKAKVCNTAVGLCEWPNIVPRASVGKVLETWPFSVSLLSSSLSPSSLCQMRFMDGAMLNSEFCWWKKEFSLWTSLGGYVWFPFLLLAAPLSLCGVSALGGHLSSWRSGVVVEPSAINIYDTVQRWCIMLNIFPWFDKRESIWISIYGCFSIIYDKGEVMVQVIPSITWFTCFFCWVL